MTDWDVDDGQGNRQRYDDDGNPISPGQAHKCPSGDQFGSGETYIPALTPQQQRNALGTIAIVIGIGIVVIILLPVGA